MSAKQQAASSGIGLGGLLFLVFVVAKLWGKVDWSWLWVASPLWIPVGVVLVFIAAVLVFASVCWTIGSIGERLAKPKLRKAKTP